MPADSSTLAQNSAQMRIAAYQRVRAASVAIAVPLSAEDCQVQSMADASPVKWHLAHTTWFFETFILETFDDDYRIFDPAFKVLYNSYYNTVGDKHPRPERGLLSRPSLDEVRAYRTHVDTAMNALLGDPIIGAAVQQLLALGVNHEQQHQELMLTDLKHMLSVNPLFPAYVPAPASVRATGTGIASTTPLPVAMEWQSFTGGLIEIGHHGETFAFDNESPRHQQFLRPYQLARRLVINREYLAFMADGGYARHELWLSDGWDRVNQGGWRAPFYWRQLDDDGGAWQEITLHGLQPLDLDAPVSHVSYFEADAYARWADARLPTEVEWEHAASHVRDALPPALPPREPSALHPRAPMDAEQSLLQLYGTLWQWTASAYLGYPGFRTAEGAVGEYNGKFMCNQFVLRGSSLATPAGHARLTYRNFFQPDKRWQFTGIRLAR